MNKLYHETVTLAFLESAKIIRDSFYNKARTSYAYEYIFSLGQIVGEGLGQHLCFVFIDSWRYLLSYPEENGGRGLSRNALVFSCQ